MNCFSDERRWAVGRQVFQGEGPRRWLKAGRCRHPCLWLQVTDLDRPDAWADPLPDRHRCRPARRRVDPQGADCPNRHVPVSLGRQRLSLGRGFSSSRHRWGGWLPLPASRCAASGAVTDPSREPSVDQITTIGIDPAQSVFQLHGVDGAAAAAMRGKLRRVRVPSLLAGLPPVPDRDGRLVPGLVTGPASRSRQATRRGSCRPRM